MPRPQRIRDPLHNLIGFDTGRFDQALWRVIQTGPFQRLRRIKQLGFSELTYPGATHSRFAHSLGVLHVARRLITVIKSHLGEQQFDETRAQIAMAAALVHDVGHGPFSHAFEDVGKRLGLKMARHEAVSELLIRDGVIANALNQSTSGFANDVADMVSSSTPADIYAAVVSSQFDAGRLDYMQRDRMMAGTLHGVFDFDWLLSNLEVGDVSYGNDEEDVATVQTLVLGPKAHHAVDTYVLGLFQLYPTVYFHKATRGAEKLFSELLCKVITLTQNGDVKYTGLPSFHPLTKFAKRPEVIDNVLSLDDATVLGSLSMMEMAKDPVIADFSHRLRTRSLYKAIDVREKIAEGISTRISGWVGLDGVERTKIIDKISAIAAEALDEKVSYYSHRLLLDSGVRPPYKRFQESNGPLNRIMIKTGGGQLIDVVAMSDVVRSIQPFKFLRAYVPADDAEANTFVSTVIHKGIEHATNT